MPQIIMWDFEVPPEVQNLEYHQYKQIVELITQKTADDIKKIFSDADEWKLTIGTEINDHAVLKCQIGDGTPAPEVMRLGYERWNFWCRGAKEGIKGSFTLKKEAVIASDISGVREDLIEADHYIIRVNKPNDVSQEGLVDKIIRSNGYIRRNAMVDFGFSDSANNIDLTGLYSAFKQNCKWKIDDARSKTYDVSGSVTGKMTAIFYSLPLTPSDNVTRQNQDIPEIVLEQSILNTERMLMEQPENNTEGDDISPEELQNVITMVWHEIAELKDSEKLVVLENLGNNDASRMIFKTRSIYQVLLERQNRELALKINKKMGRSLRNPETLLLCRLKIIENIYHMSTQESQNEQIKKKAFYILRDMGKPCIDILISELRKEGSSCQASCLIALGEAAVRQLIDELDNPQTEKKKIIDILSTIEDSRAIEPLIKELHNADKAIRKSASQALVRITQNSYIFGNDDYRKWEKWWAENKHRF